MFKNSQRLMAKSSNSKSTIILDLEKLTLEDREFIENNLPQIYDGRTTKKDSKISAKFFLEKIKGWNEKQRIGVVAEFCLICILRNHNFSQEFCFNNLEENSLKKGFDGLYLDENNKIWIAESKASQKSENKHKVNLRNAYNTLEKTLEGKSERKSNVWENAYNHSRIVNADDSLQKKLSNLSANYLKGIYTRIEDHKIIICSTVYNPDINKVERSKDKIEEWIKTHISRQELAVIVTTNSINIIVNVLEDIVQ